MTEKQLDLLLVMSRFFLQVAKQYRWEIQTRLAKVIKDVEAERQEEKEKGA